MRSGHTNQCINSWNKPLLADIEEQLERVVIVVEPGHHGHVDLAFTLVYTHTRKTVYIHIHIDIYIYI